MANSAVLNLARHLLRGVSGRTRLPKLSRAEHEACRQSVILSRHKRLHSRTLFPENSFRQKVSTS
jgi:hypothetical protein